MRKTGLVLMNGVFWAFWVSMTNSQAQDSTDAGKVSIGFPVPTYRVSEEVIGPSLGAPLITKPKEDAAPEPKATTIERIETPPTPSAVISFPDPVVQPKSTGDADEFQLKPPTPDELFRVESEAASRERIRRAALQRKIKVTEFPQDLPLPTVEKIERPTEPVLVATYAPSAICYHPLYFEQRLPERYGFFVPLAQPILSAGKFYADALVLPYRAAVHRPWQWECSHVSLCR